MSKIFNQLDFEQKKQVENIIKNNGKNKEIASSCEILTNLYNTDKDAFKRFKRYFIKYSTESKNNEWTEDDQKIFDNLYSLYSESKNKFKLISEADERMKYFYDWDYLYLASKVKKEKKQGILKCDLCNEILTQKMLISTDICNLCCKKSNIPKLLTKKLDWVTYIIQNKKYKSLTDPVIYIGHTSDLHTRLKTHQKNNLYNPKKHNLFVSICVGEIEMIKILRPEENKNIGSFSNMRIKDGQIYIEKKGEKSQLDEESIQLYKLLIKFDENIQLYNDQQEWCFDKRNQKCNHVPTCVYKRYWNAAEDKSPVSHVPEEFYTESAIKEHTRYLQTKNYDNTPLENPKDLYSVVNRKHLEQSTVISYKSFIKRIKDNKIDEYISCPEIFIKKCLLIYTPNTVSTVLIIISSYLSCLNLKEKKEILGKNFREIIAKYKSMMIILSKYKTAMKSKGIKNLKEENNWILFSDLEKVCQYYKQEKEKEPFLYYQKYILCLFYIYIGTLRSDYYDLKYNNIDHEKDNYIENGLLFFNTMIKNNNKQSFKIKKIYYDEITDYIDYIKKMDPNREYLFLCQNKKFNRGNFTKYVRNTFSSQLENKSIGINMIRKIVATEKNKTVNLPHESANIAKSMNHSVKMNTFYYNKNNKRNSK